MCQRWGAVVGLALAIPVALAQDSRPATQPAGPLRPGFERGPHFNEQIKTYTFDPDVRVHINVPGDFDDAKPTRLVFFALPNGNTIEQTIGRQREEGLDWHFYIQHIGAQTRRLRELMKDENLVVVYLEAGGRSWPSWRAKHEDNPALIAKLIDSIRTQFDAARTRVALTSHSGGGSLIFGFINHYKELPEWLDRIVWLDADYGYSDAQQHGDKLIHWLKASPKHTLGVYAYDDRRIKVNGKLVVGPTGGTYRKTQKMLERLRKDLDVTQETRPEYNRYRALDGRLDVIVVENPEDKIWHTVLVEKNGFIHALAFATPFEAKAGEFWGPAAYEPWIASGLGIPEAQ